MAGLATLTLARLYAQQGDPERAMAIYHQLLDSDPGNAVILEEMSALMDRWPSLDGNQSKQRRLKALDREIRLLQALLSQSRIGEKKE